jgi:hypothetical protein
MKVNILQEIERLRQALYDEIHLSAGLTDREVIKASQDLDNILHEYYKTLIEEGKLGQALQP